MKLTNIIKESMSDNTVKFLNSVVDGDWHRDRFGYINVDGDVNMSRIAKRIAYKFLEPRNILFSVFKFGYVTGNYNIQDNGMVKLFGPMEVGGNFAAFDNALKSLEGGPKTVGGDYIVPSNKLISLKGSPKEVGGAFSCANNQLTSLEGAPKEVGDNFICFGNEISSLEYAPTSVGGGFYCYDNKFDEEPDHSFIQIGGEFRWIK